VIKPMIDCHSRVKICVIAQSFHVPSRFSSVGTGSRTNPWFMRRKPAPRLKKGFIRRERSCADVAKSRHAGSVWSCIKEAPNRAVSTPSATLYRAFDIRGNECIHTQYHKCRVSFSGRQKTNTCSLFRPRFGPSLGARSTDVADRSASAAERHHGLLAEG
jgi:hypothetical protein